MKSNKQKRAELDVRSKARRVKQAAAEGRAAEQKRQDERRAAIARGAVPVDPAKLAPSHSAYSTPDFVQRGWYEPRPFVCAGCGASEVWTGRQQKWWYEIAGGDRFSGPKFCRSCRAKERSRKAEARRVHLEGVKNKAAPGAG